MFKIEANDGNARAGVLKTAHGKVETPFFMPVATKGAVKQISGDDLNQLKAGAIISNSFLLSLKPGVEYLRDNGGIHRYINYKKTIFTDSGGFQMLSKSLFKGISDKGVKFKNPFNGKTHFLSPEDVMDIQDSIKSDVSMVLDHVSNWGESHDAFRKSLLRTMKWAEIQKKYHDANFSSKQLLFGIVQGGLFRDLKEFSIRHANSLDFDGIAIGGLAFGEPREEMLSALDHSLKFIDMKKIHYLMGIGEPTDIVESVARGMDCFDSRFPTMNARHGTIMTSKGRLMIKNREYRDDQNPIDEKCSCFVCKNYSRAYMHNMLRFREGVGLRLATYHNLHYIMQLMKDIRLAIKEERFEKFRKDFIKIYNTPDRGKFSY